jgi:anaerobic magnesium-protoporphyrin IX monomethyl ester cyclase
MRASTDSPVVLIGLMGTRWLANRLLHAVLKSRGIPVHTIFLREDYEKAEALTETEIRHVLQLLEELKPRLVGMSLTSFFAQEAKQLTARIKEALDVPVLWGGIHPTVDPLSSLKYADMVCLGEGEEALVELAEAFDGPNPRTDVANVWFRTNGTIIRNAQRDLIADLDALPFPDLSDENKYYVVNNRLYREHNPIPYHKYEYDIVTGRGCPYKCTYCASHILCKTGGGRFLRRRTAQNVMEELREAMRHLPKIERVNFWDDVFTYDREWLAEFSAAYAREFHIPAFCYVHPSMIDEERARMLAEMGIRDVAVGFQHGSVRIRKEYFERNESDAAILDAISLLNQKGFRVHLDMIATPFDTEQDSRDNMELLLRVPKPFGLYAHTLTFFPGYKITDRALAEGAIGRDQVVGDSYRSEIAASKAEILEDPWLCYQSLVGKSWIPNRVIRRMIAAQFHRRHARLLRFFASLVLKMDRLLDLYRHNIGLLKHMELWHFFSVLRGLRNSRRHCPAPGSGDERSAPGE